MAEHIGRHSGDGSYWTADLHISKPSPCDCPPDGLLKVKVCYNSTNLVIHLDEHGISRWTAQYPVDEITTPTLHFPGNMNRNEYYSFLHQWLESSHLNLPLRDDVATDLTNRVIDRAFKKLDFNGKLAISVTAYLHHVSIEYASYDVPPPPPIVDSDSDSDSDDDDDNDNNDDDGGDDDGDDDDDDDEIEAYLQRVLNENESNVPPPIDFEDDDEANMQRFTIRHASMYVPQPIDSDDYDDDYDDEDDDEGLSEYWVKGLSCLYRFVASEEDGRIGNCPICLEGLVSDKEEEEGSEYLFRSPCGHVFHDECMVEWLRKRDSCPLCRFTVSSQIR